VQQRPNLPPPPTEVEYCYRHPGVETAVHCTRCGRPICPDCMIPAPVGHHCPTCVAEARAEYKRGPGRRVAVANAKGISAVRFLVFCIAVVFVIEVLVGGAGSLFDGPNTNTLIRLGASVPLWPGPNGGLIGVAAGQYWRLFTAMFLHFGIIHFAVNTYSLFLLGTLLEREVGRWRFLVLYLLCGLFASASSFAFASVAVVNGLHIPVVGAGASGAIFGVFGAFLSYAWRRRNTAMGAAWLRAGVQIIVLNVVLNIALASVLDWRAHIGGLAAGLLAGFAADARGPESTRRAVFAAGMIVIAVAAVVLVAARAPDIRSLLGA
jgi:membrane associated rhomboid family serine protease